MGGTAPITVTPEVGGQKQAPQTINVPVVPPGQQIMRNHPRAPHLRLVVSQDRPGARRFNANNVLERMFATFGGGAPAA